VAAGQMTFWLDGQAGQSYSLQSSTNLVNWGRRQHQYTFEQLVFLIPLQPRAAWLNFIAAVGRNKI